MWCHEFRGRVHLTSSMRRILVCIAISVLAAIAAIASGGEASAADPPEPTVAVIPTSTGMGYLIVTEAGRVFSYGDAPDFGGLVAHAPLNQPIVGGSMTVTNAGYWLWASDGGVFAFGDAEFHGSTGGIALNQPVVGGAATSSGNGYWLWASDGGVFAFGDAEFRGSMGAIDLAQPIVGGGPTPSGDGYWLWASDGGAFAFGDAPFLGSLGAIALDRPIIAGGPTASGRGYLFIGADGGSFAFGDAVFPGSSAERNVLFAGGAVTPSGDGLWLITGDGYLEVLGSAPRLGAPQVGPPPSPDRPLDEVAVSVNLFGSGFSEPVDITIRPGDNGAIYVAERDGLILRVDVDDATSRSTVLDITAMTSTDSERGLLSVVFSNDGTLMFINHTNIDGNLRVAEYTMVGDLALVSSRRDLISIDQPFANHNGGDIAIGPDDYLYIASGDGGSGGDPQNNAQNLGNLLGAVLRIDPTPSGGSPYTIPADNPFVGVPGARGEIWALGLRNPWRFDFDDATGNLWIGDVGQNAYEEVDVIPAGIGGINFGWRVREGAHPFSGSNPGGLVDPVYEYGHDSGCSITGGVIVADPRLSDLAGHYLFSDFCQSDLWALRVDGATVVDASPIAGLPSRPVSFGEGPSGEIYVATLGGTISRIDP
jgi:glucose/arabinose dehydrogenase